MQFSSCFKLLIFGTSDTQPTSAFMASAYIFVTSLFVFCLLASLLLISSPSISKHPKAHSASGAIGSTRVDNRTNDVHLIQTNYLKSSFQTFHVCIAFDCEVPPHLHATPQSLSSDCRTVATPLAALLGVKETTRVKATYIPTLESHYCKITKNPTKVDVAVNKKTRCTFNSDPNVFSLAAPSDFDSESLQADGIHGKTSAAMVPETKEPGPAQLAQEVSGSQVNTDMGAHS